MTEKEMVSNNSMGGFYIALSITSFCIGITPILAFCFAVYLQKPDSFFTENYIIFWGNPIIAIISGHLLRAKKEKLSDFNAVTCVFGYTVLFFMLLAKILTVLDNQGII